MSMRNVRVFPGIIFAFIAMNMCIVAVTVYLALSDQSFAVEPDYYQKALAWDQVARRRQRSDVLGWRAAAKLEVRGDARVLVVSLSDRDGTLIDGAGVKATVFASVRASERFEIVLQETLPGEYVHPMLDGVGGQWQVRLSATRGDAVFESVATVEDAGTDATKAGAR